MSMLERMITCAGNWRGTSKLQDPDTGSPDESPSTATVTSVLGGKFVRLDYTWAYHKAPQEGSLLIGFDAKADAVTAHWIDTWHMGDKVMACLGPRPSNPTLSARGSYAVPSGPDWGWRIDITPVSSDDERTLRIVMFNVWPDGREELAVEAHYTRA